VAGFFWLFLGDVGVGVVAVDKFYLKKEYCDLIDAHKKKLF
jgi:hypothetical protein